MCCLPWQAMHYLCISIEKHKRSFAFLNNNKKKNPSSYGGPMRLSYSFYRPSALGHRLACCAFLPFFSRKKRNQPSLFHDSDCKFDKLNHNIQSIFFNSLLVPQLFKKKKKAISPFIINDLFLINLK